MAGNGFAFAKAYDFTMEHILSVKPGWELGTLSFISFLGVAFAYAALWRPAHDRWAKIGEFTSAFCVIYSVGVWSGVITYLALR